MSNERNWTLTLMTYGLLLVTVAATAFGLWLAWTILAWWFHSPNWFEYGAIAVITAVAVADLIRLLFRG